MNSVISVQNLHKRYGSKEVLKGIRFQVQQGEIFALLGANGAGKTTALACMEGLRKYEQGSIEIHGRRGIQLQSASLPAHIRAAEAVNLFSRWSNAAPDTKMLADLGINDLGRRQYQQMSTGQKRRLHLALALIGSPDILFLDEPTAGLDVEGQAALHHYLRLLKDEGKTILLASHDMAEVESLCDRLAILEGGQIIFTGTVSELTKRAGTLYHVQIISQDGTENLEMHDIAAELVQVLRRYKESRRNIMDIKIDRGSLEEHFLQILKEAK